MVATAGIALVVIVVGAVFVVRGGSSPQAATEAACGALAVAEADQEFTFDAAQDAYVSDPSDANLARLYDVTRDLFDRELRALVALGTAAAQLEGVDSEVITLTARLEQKGNELLGLIDDAKASNDSFEDGPLNGRTMSVVVDTAGSLAEALEPSLSSLPACGGVLDTWL